jgi:hypothetical protein
MHDQCTICLEDFEVPREDHDAADLAGLFTPRSPTPAGRPVHSLAVALIPVCGHVLHDTCLKEWAERSNSCPICRTTFNLVEVLDKIGGRFPYVFPISYLSTCSLLLDGRALGVWRFPRQSTKSPARVVDITDRPDSPNRKRFDG